MKKIFAALAVVVAATVAQAEGPIDITYPTEYGVPGWLQDLNEQFAGHGPATEPCGSGELYPCSDVEASVPEWLQDLNQWFVDHGTTAPAYPGVEAP